MASKAAGAVFLLLLLTFGAEAKMCKWRSQTFKGRCTHNDNCVTICTTENATGGYCHGRFHRRCICTKQCGGPPENPPPEGPPGGAPEDPPEGPGDPPGDERPRVWPKVPRGI